MTATGYRQWQTGSVVIPLDYIIPRTFRGGLFFSFFLFVCGTRINCSFFVFLPLWKTHCTYTRYLLGFSPGIPHRRNDERSHHSHASSNPTTFDSKGQWSNNNVVKPRGLAIVESKTAKISRAGNHGVSRAIACWSINDRSRTSSLRLGDNRALWIHRAGLGVEMRLSTSMFELNLVLVLRLGLPFVSSSGTATDIC